MLRITSVVNGAPVFSLDPGDTYDFSLFPTAPGQGFNTLTFDGKTYLLGAGPDQLILAGNDTVTVGGAGTTVISAGDDLITLNTGQSDTIDAGPGDTIIGGSGYPVINAVGGDIITTGAGGGYVNAVSGAITVNAALIAVNAVVAQASLSGTSVYEGGAGVTLTAPGVQVTTQSSGQYDFLDGSINDPADTAVNQLYQLALGRSSDPIGIGYAESLLGFDGNPVGSFAPQVDVELSDKTAFFQEVVQSAEFQAKYGSLSNADFIATLYQNSGLTEDTAGGTYWTQLLDQGVSKASVLNGFATDTISPFSSISALTTTTAPTFIPTLQAASVTALYETALGRAPDTAGYTASILAENAGVTPLQLAQAYATSPEFTAAGNTQSSSAFVAHIIATAFGTPDPAATNYWASAIDTGQVSRAGVVLAYADSAAMYNKVAAILATTHLSGT